VRDPTTTFRVTNPGEMPPRAARHIFERGFSTKKGHGRGLGTWSMKLLGEGILGGAVGFYSADETTVFWLSLPA
jgi:sensor histidine kinase regulating citrate/malate metabolism